MDNTENEYVEPGDLLEFLTDVDLVCFNIPTPGRLEHKSIVSAYKGDVVRYLGVRYHARTHGLLTPIPVYEFLLIRLNDDGEVQDEYRFFMPNVETILKWTEKLE